MYKITFGAKLHTLYPATEHVKSYAVEALRARGYEVLEAVPHDTGIWNGAERMLSVSGSLSSRSETQAFFLTDSEETSLKVLDALTVLHPEAALKGTWISKPE